MRMMNEYQQEAMSYRLPSADESYALLNLAGEVGELMSLIAKSIRDGEKEDHYENVVKELGDVLWSVAAIAEDNGFTLQDVADFNLSKLRSRKLRDKLQGSGDNR